MTGELLGKVVQFFLAANKKTPHGLGHTLFLGIKDEIGLKRLWNHKLRFILEKMFRFEPEVLRELTTAYGTLSGDQKAPGA
jgi:hypothetical protein